MNRDLLEEALRLIAAGRPTAVFPVVGRSMRPTLRDGDEVRVDLRRRRPVPGDLVLFRQGADTVVHRCVGGSDGAWRMRGDGRQDLDPPVAAEAILGIAEAIRRDGTWWRLGTTGARAWALAVSRHCRFWAAAMRPFAPGASARRPLGWADRTALRWADRLLFRVVHRRGAETGR